MKIGIIGGGPGGYSAALRASNKGIDVTLFEKADIGGVCLNEGCIPTKALIKCASLKNSFKKSKRFGFRINEFDHDWKRIQNYKEHATKRLVMGVIKLLESKGVEIVNKKAGFSGKRELYTEDKNYIFDNIIIATGSTPVNPPFPLPDDVWTSREALETDKLPGNLLIVGAGAIGMEFGYIFSSFDTDVTIIELEEEIVPGENKETMKSLRNEMKKNGIEFHLSSMITGIEKKNGRFTTVFSKDDKELTIESDRVLVSIGRKPYIDKLPEEIEIENGAIKVDNCMKTSIDNVYAIGDCTGGYLLAHVAYREAAIAIENISGNRAEFSNLAIPRVIYTEPEFAAIGETEEELRKRGIEFNISTFPYSANGRAVTSGETTGEIRLLHTEEGDLLGCSILGSNASELITQLSIAIEKGITAGELSNIIFPHPTISEAIKEASSIADGKPVH